MNSTTWFTVTSWSSTSPGCKLQWSEIKPSSHPPSLLSLQFSAWQTAFPFSAAEAPWCHFLSHFSDCCFCFSFCYLSLKDTLFSFLITCSITESHLLIFNQHLSVGDPSDSLLMVCLLSSRPAFQSTTAPLHSKVPPAPYTQNLRSEDNISPTMLAFSTRNLQKTWSSRMIWAWRLLSSVELLTSLTIHTWLTVKPSAAPSSSSSQIQTLIFILFKNYF